MPAIHLKLDGDACWPDLKPLRDDGRLVDLTGDKAPPIGLAMLLGGTVGGRPTVTIRVDLPDGRVVLTETTLALLDNAVRAMNARARIAHGDGGLASGR